MPDENKNPEEEQVQSSEEATDEALTLEQIAGKTPEEQLELYNNSREAIKAATQRNMETAEDKKRYEAERDLIMGERQRQDDEIKRLNAQITQYNELTQRMGQPKQPSPINYDELTPEQQWVQMREDQRKTQEKLAAIEKQQADEIQKVRGEVQSTQRAIEYRRFLENEIFSEEKYGFVTEQKINDWFTQHPTINPDPKTVHFAAADIQKQEDAVVEARVQARLAEKAKKAKEAELVTSGTPLAALPGDKKFIDMDPAEQEAQLRKDIERSQKQ